MLDTKSPRYSELIVLGLQPVIFIKDESSNRMREKIKRAFFNTSTNRDKRLTGLNIYTTEHVISDQQGFILTAVSNYIRLQ